jgi:hypothetical protein
MYHLDIHHEYVLLNMFMHSLEVDVRQWHFSLPHSCISSLKEFHIEFNYHCRRFFPVKSLFEGFCVEFKLYIQEYGSSSNIDGREFNDEEVEEHSILHESFSSSFVQEEYLLENNFEDKSPYNHIAEKFDIVLDLPNSVCYDAFVVQNFNEDRLIFDEYLDDSKENFPASTHVEFFKHVYDKYASNSLEGSGENEEAIQHKQNIVEHVIPTLGIDETIL